MWDVKCEMQIGTTVKKGLAPFYLARMNGVKWKMWDVRCEMWDEICEMRDVKCEMWDESG